MPRFDLFSQLCPTIINKSHVFYLPLLLLLLLLLRHKRSLSVLSLLSVIMLSHRLLFGCRGPEPLLKHPVLWLGGPSQPSTVFAAGRSSFFRPDLLASPPPAPVQTSNETQRRNELLEPKPGAEAGPSTHLLYAIVSL